MATTYFHILGTAEQVNEIQAALPMTKADRVQYKQKIYPHMIQKLQIEIWELAIVKRTLTPAFVQSLKKAIEDHPKSIYYAYTRGDDPTKGASDYNGEMLSNFYQDNCYEYPGPFGALCRLYGISYRPTK
jgi:hypothetical protein